MFQNKILYLTYSLSVAISITFSFSYTSTQDLQNILSAGNNQVDRLGNNIKPPSIGSLTKNVQGYDSLPSCFNLSPFNKGNDENRYNIDDEQDEDIEPNKDVQCQCSRKVFLNWYPCALKYCQNKDGDGEHRCGIRTCRKTITYQWPSTLRFCTTIEADEVQLIKMISSLNIYFGYIVGTMNCYLLLRRNVFEEV